MQFKQCSDCNQVDDLHSTNRTCFFRTFLNTYLGINVHTLHLRHPLVALPTHVVRQSFPAYGRCATLNEIHPIQIGRMHNRMFTCTNCIRSIITACRYFLLPVVVLVFPLSGIHCKPMYQGYLKRVNDYYTINVAHTGIQPKNQLSLTTKRVSFSPLISNRAADTNIENHKFPH